MKNILIVNFGTSKDILMSSHLISALREENPALNISILIRKKYLKVANLLNHVAHIYPIDTDYITEIEKNNLYPDIYALNAFSASITEVVKTSWDKVVNYSNDDFSSYFVKALNSTEISGTYINNEDLPKTNSSWSNAQNHVFSQTENPSIATAVVRNHILNLPIYERSTKIKVNEDYLIMANQNFIKVRKMKDHSQVKIIGINLEVGYAGHALDLETLKDITETLEESQKFKVILLTSDKSFQKEIINELNSFHGKKLISIDVETDAISAVLSNLDLIISSANDQLSMADCLGVKTIELKDRHQNIAPTTISEGGVIIYQSDIKQMSDDIILSINEEFTSELPVTAINNTNPTYICIRDDYGTSYSQMRGEIDIQAQLSKHVERSVIFQCMGFEKNQKLIQQIQSAIDPNEREVFITKVRSEVTETVKVLLATLRSLKSARTSKKQLNSFLTYLGDLMQLTHGDSIASNLVRIFEGNIENIESLNTEQNMQQIENHLFELKSHLQVLMNFVSELNKQEESQPVDGLNL